MSGRSPRPDRECDLVCYGLRLAAWMFLAGLALLLLLAAAVHAGEPQELLIEAGGAEELFVEADGADQQPTSRAASIQKAPVRPDLVARAKFPDDEPVLIDILATVNRAVNGAIVPADDQAHYGQAERFVAWPADGKGDCEDYALSKMELLGNLGVPLAGNAILLSVIVHHDGRMDGHAILQLRLPGGGFMYLDNMFEEPMTKRELVAAGYQFFDWRDGVADVAPSPANQGRL